MVVIVLIFVFIASVCEAIMDTLAHHFKDSIFSNRNPNFWNPVLSGSNKWKNGDKKQGEKFFLSSTLLVGITEAWHLFKTIRTFCLFAIMGVFEWHFTKSIQITLMIRVMFGIVFTVWYSHVLKRD